MAKRKKPPKRKPTERFDITEAVIRSLAGGTYFKRGLEYFDAGLVGSISERNGRLSARVNGTHTYRVALWMEDGALLHECSCPLGEDDEFCKHCVAAGLAWIERNRDKPRGEEPASATDVRAWLEKRSKAELVDLLLEAADGSETVGERLYLLAARDTGGGPDLAAFREAIDNATATGGFVHYGEMYDFCRRIDMVVDSLRQLANGDCNDGTVELIEYAIAAVEGALNECDDSSGGLGGILDDLVELHHRVCARAKPDPAQLAKRLFAWELGSPWETFSGSAERYADVLGKTGLAEYRRLAEAEWQKVPALKPGDDDRERWHGRFRITSIMKSLARADDDVDALIDVMRRDLSSPYCFLEIAKVCKENKRRDEALEWAERGVKAFPDKPDERLHEFLADLYHVRKRHAEAMELIWQLYVERPCLESYRRLQAHAQKAKAWKAWREKALAHLRADIERAAKDPNERRWGPNRLMDNSRLVEILLWERKDIKAWREAKAGGCNESLWLTLAKRREKKHPEDAIPIYRRQIEPILKQTNKDAYREATKLLLHLRDLMRRVDREDDFATDLASIRAAHKRKRNFMKELDRAKLG